MAARVLISARIDEEDREEIDKIIERTGAKLSDVVRDVISEHFAKVREQRQTSNLMQ